MVPYKVQNLLTLSQVRHQKNSTNAIRSKVLHKKCGPRAPETQRIGKYTLVL